MLGYVIAAFVAVMVFAPVMWMMPSPRQRRQERMRDRARQLGVDVRLSELPQTRRARVRREAPRQGACYRLAGAPTAARSLLVCRDGAGSPWELPEGDPPDSSVLALLLPFTRAVPADVAAVELNPAAPAAYWRESGDAASVELLAAALVTLRDGLMSVPVSGPEPDSVQG